MTQPIEIRSARIDYEGAPFPGTELPSLPEAIAEVDRWIDSGESEQPGRWNAWPDRPDFEPIYGSLSLNTGAAGVAWYSLAASRAGLGEGHAARARRAADYVASSWRSALDSGPFPLPGIGLAHYGGLAGIADVFLELAELDPRYREVAVQQFDELAERSGRTGGREHGWTGLDGVLGDGGIVLALLGAADRLGEPRYREAAVRVGELILADERPDSSWPGTPPAVFGMPDGTELDGFELGSIGIAFVLGRLAEATGDERFAAAAGRAADAIAAGLVTVGDASLVLRGDGSYFFGYCTGSSGAIRSLVEVFHATGERRHLDRALSLGRGILRSGVPGRATKGNAHVYHQCCGSAAILESFLGLWLETGDRLWLDAARAQGDDLLVSAHVDAQGRRWYSESHVLPTGTLKAEVGHQVGASGIALALLRLHQALEADAASAPFSTIRLPDDPYPTARG